MCYSVLQFPNEVELSSIRRSGAFLRGVVPQGRHFLFALFSLRYRNATTHSFLVSNDSADCRITLVKVKEKLALPIVSATVHFLVSVCRYRGCRSFTDALFYLQEMGELKVTKLYKSLII